MSVPAGRAHDAPLIAPDSERTLALAENLQEPLGNAVEAQHVHRLVGEDSRPRSNPASDVQDRPGG
jgi:hypothetical protein